MSRLSEPPRARRIRDRRRIIEMLVRRFAHQSGMDRPTGFHDHFFFWTDDAGNRRLGVPEWDDIHELRLKRARRHHGNRASCSCAACGNPRKHGGYVTVAEGQASESAAVQFDEFGLSAPRKPKLA